MKTLLVNLLIIFTSLYCNAPNTHIQCGYDSTLALDTLDPIIAKVEYRNPTIYTRKYRITESSKTIFPILSPITERMTIWATIIDPNGEEKELNTLTEFHFDCNRSEVVIVASELLKMGSVLQINWICGGNEK